LQKMSVKPVTPAIENHVKGLWEKALEKDISQEVVFVEQYAPSKDLMNEFEHRRNELDRTLGGQKLQTIQAFCTVNYKNLPGIIKHGFYKTLGVSKIAFSTDPGVAINEGFGGNNNKILLCRITLGREGVDYQVVRNKYMIENLQGIMPSFLITYAAPGESISLQPFETGTSSSSGNTKEEEIVFQEARIVQYDSVVKSIEDNAVNVFGEANHPLKTEEDRLLRHMTKKS